MAKLGIKQRARAGETVLGSMVFEFFVPGMPAILAQAGAEYAIYDMEHGGLGYETLKMLCAASRGTGVAPMVRVPHGDYHFIARALDVGVHGVMVPMIESAEAARAIVAAARYPKRGRRGAAFGFAHDGYTGGDPLPKMRGADERTLVIAQIETAVGLEKVEEIAAVEGVDCLWMGQFDMSNFLGIPGQFAHPEFQGAIKRIVAAGRAHGKALGYMAASPALAAEYRQYGFNMIASGTDPSLLIGAVRGVLTAVPGKG